ncbi:MAG: HAMP domain-containing histidine kinase [Spirochaetales bacterium]|nr:HAMP domain-containing histidine kinase [Spirochaetales bacterium]
MRRRRRSPIAIFVLAQVAWFALLGLWIYWYVSNYMIFVEVGEKISPQFVFSAKNIVALVGGIVLLVAVATAMVLIFSSLAQQMKINRMYDNFIANVTHELKSPLASLQLYVETLSSREVPPEKRAEFLGLMTKDTERLHALIHSILEISGLEEKRRMYQPRVYRGETLVYRLVEEAVEQFRLPAGAVEITGQAPCACRADRRALRMVFNNLFDNAIKYTKGPAHLTVALRCTPRRFSIDVTDRGIGIPEKERKEVFKKFTRLYNPDNPTVKGTGLGLYWVREIIRHHRGTIRVISQGRNMGTTFHIELPVVPGTYRPAEIDGSPEDGAPGAGAASAERAPSGEEA